MAKNGPIQEIGRQIESKSPTLQQKDEQRKKAQM
jgi:hypothetical protein